MTRHILLAEDEPGLVLTLTDRLVSEGYTVESASDGKLALEGGHDVIITDVRMPRLGGREFYERLRILRREREGGMDGLLMAMATGYDYRKYQRVKSLERKGSK